MKSFWTSLGLVFLLASGAFAAPQHRWVCVENGGNKLIHINQKDPSSNWVVDIPVGSRDLQALENNTLLVSHGNGAAEYDLATGLRKRWVAYGYQRIQTARRLENGNTLLASISGTLYELDPSGKEISATPIDMPELDIRLIRLTPEGTLLIGAKKPMAVLEVTRSGTVLKTIPLPGKGYKAMLLPDGNILAGTGSMVKLLTLTPAGKTLAYVGGKAEHPKLGLDFCSGWDLLKNGNRVMANWQGHGNYPTAPHLIEFTPENKVVWTWGDHTIAKQITNVLFLE